MHSVFQIQIMHNNHYHHQHHQSAFVMSLAYLLSGSLCKLVNRINPLMLLFLSSSSPSLISFPLHLHRPRVNFRPQLAWSEITLVGMFIGSLLHLAHLRNRASPFQNDYVVKGECYIQMSFFLQVLLSVCLCASLGNRKGKHAYWAI